MKQQSLWDMHGFGIKGYPGPPGLGGWQSHPIKLIFVEELLKLETRQKQQRQHSINKD